MHVLVPVPVLLTACLQLLAPPSPSSHTTADHPPSPPQTPATCGPQCLELVCGEMRRADLPPSMRRGLLRIGPRKRPLVQHRRVREVETGALEAFLGQHFLVEADNRNPVLRLGRLLWTPVTEIENGSQLGAAGHQKRAGDNDRNGKARKDHWAGP